MAEKKYYSAKQKKSYHERRVTTLYNSRHYSERWLDGYGDEKASVNLPHYENEIAKYKRDKLPYDVYLAGLYGYRNGAREQLKKSKK